MSTKYKNGERLVKGVASIKFKAGPQDGLEEGEFTAYAAVKNNIDSYGDKIVDGAFKKTLSTWDVSGNFIPLLFGHNMSDPDFNLGHVITATEDEKGLLVHGKLDLSNPKSLQTYKLLKGKRLDQLSFAYIVTEGAWVDSKEEGGYYELRELDLLEVSLVTVGANRATHVTGVKEHGTKAGRTISAKTEKRISSAVADAKAALAAAQAVVAGLEELLAEVTASPDAEAEKQGDSETKSASTDEPVVAAEEPVEVKAANPMRQVSVAALEAELNLLAL
jgi:HK97 family phage prohead protease